MNRPSRARAVLFVLLAASATPHALRAQTPLLEFPDAAGNEGIAMSFAAAGDVDGDGIGDVVLGRARDLGHAGSLALASGRNGTEIWRRNGNFGGQLGRAVAAGVDLDGDGVGDVVSSGLFVGTVVSIHVQLLSGDSGALIWAVAEGSPGSTALAFAGDLDGDGKSEVLCGQPGAFVPPNVTGRVIVRSGSTGQALYTRSGVSNDFFGHALAILGDLDADGVPEFAVGAPQSLLNGITTEGTGYVQIYSGRTGTLWRRIDGSIARSGFGMRLASPGDLDGDSFADLVVSAPLETGGGAVYLYSTASGALIRRHAATSAEQQLGHDIAALGDLDGDRVREYAIGTPGESGSGVVRIHSGVSGTVYAVLISAPGDRFGARLAYAGDPFGDGAEDLWVGCEPAAPVTGWVVLNSGANVSRIGRGCRDGAIPPTVALDRLRLGLTSTFTGATLPSATAGNLLFSLAPSLPRALDPECTLYLDPLTLFGVIGVVSDHAGGSITPVALPVDPWLVGTTIGAQMCFPDAFAVSGVALTHGIYAAIDL